ncbi:nuclear transport factor 2 family protein [Streptacidiphilus sp. PB12-B1b]|uniref:nuclear transport factor 2 family protein n=1 Tax=Streptacidiphilus sp. PB12-B1b TaxID=2705012 RepID=UPI0015FD2FD3|nr:nuclear transport factor 2 family protein [Streptacidiphilus sp. PB12-B1b]QMU77010.1 nuclear transport factor 2 family protein [Streptacidiphilus sp. PB12-B1b]
MTAELTVQDREEIRQLLAHFAHVFDNGRRDALDQVFTEDGSIELVREQSRFFHGLDAIREFNERLGERSPDHHTLDTVLTVDPDGTVRGHSRYLAMLADGSVHNGDYLDVLVRTPQGWRIRQRRSVPRYPVAD